ncbi:MAG: hypothetical protein GEU76_01670 [Alphaproteobacteria bacterium]|nr:hypothetical protein [Alphaproteobacteria bacterium]
MGEPALDVGHFTLARRGFVIALVARGRPDIAVHQPVFLATGLASLGIDDVVGGRVQEDGTVFLLPLLHIGEGPQGFDHMGIGIDDLERHGFLPGLGPERPVICPQDRPSGSRFQVGEAGSGPPSGFGCSWPVTGVCRRPCHAIERQMCRESSSDGACIRREHGETGIMNFHNQLALVGAILAIAWPSGSAHALEDWNSVLAQARQEGLVVVHGAPGKSYADAMVRAFNKAHPDIRVQFSGASNRTDVPKLLRERKASIYAWDVWVSGAGTAVSRLKPQGIFQPLRQYLRKETMEDKHWHGEFGAGWMDNEKQFFYSFEGTVQNPVSVNWEFVKKSSITSIKDLLKPEFAGKIIWHDPRFNGSGNGASQTLFVNFGEDFLRAFYRQKIVYATNRRQIADWVVRGRYPIALGLDENDVKVFQSQGLGKQIEPLPEVSTRSSS